MNWKIYYFRVFQDQIRLLAAELARLRKKNPEKLKGHPKLRLFLALKKVMAELRNDPMHDKYRLGQTLGKEYGDWRRIKKNGLPDRYRLFFKFFSQHEKIFLVWLNDETTYRKEGARTDCYAIFRKMLNNGQIPSEYAALLENSSPEVSDQK